jgi:FkbM family methyltransferase
MKIQPNELSKVETLGEAELWIFHNTIGDEGVLGLSVKRRGAMGAETACLLVSRTAHTQRVMHHLFEEAHLYEEWTSSLALGALRTGDVAIDVGAHVGLFSTLFRLGVGPSGSVYGFEPMPETYRRFLRNVMYNRFTNVLPLQLAVSEQSGNALFHIDLENEGESSLLRRPEEDSCNVQVTSLDEIFCDALPKRPRVLKIDAEGVEPSILRGGSRLFETHAPDLVICEYNRGLLLAAGASEWILRDFFRDRGYACAVINNGQAMDLAGGKYYRYLKPEEESTPPDFAYVYNLMFVRNGSGLYPSPFL